MIRRRYALTVRSSRWAWRRSSSSTAGGSFTPTKASRWLGGLCMATRVRPGQAWGVWDATRQEFLPRDLPKDHPFRLAVLKALVEVDRERRHGIGQAISLHDYLNDYPELVDAFVQEFEKASADGSPPDIDEFLADIDPDTDGAFRRTVLKALVDVERNRRRQAFSSPVTIAT